MLPAGEKQVLLLRGWFLVKGGAVVSLEDRLELLRLLLGGDLQVTLTWSATGYHFAQVRPAATVEPGESSGEGERSNPLTVGDARVVLDGLLSELAGRRVRERDYVG